MKIQNIYFLLHGLACNGCVKGLTKRLSDLRGIYSFAISKANLLITIAHNADSQQIIQQIEQAAKDANKQATVTDEQSYNQSIMQTPVVFDSAIYLQLLGLSCGNCIQGIKDTIINNFPQIEPMIIEINCAYLKFKSPNDSFDQAVQLTQDIIQAINRDEKYSAKLINQSEFLQLLSEHAIDQESTNPKLHTSPILPTNLIYFKLIGLTCDHCLQTVSKIINSFNNTQIIEIKPNLAKIQSSIPAEQIIAAIYATGEYKAELITAEQYTSLYDKSSITQTTNDVYFVLQGLTCQNCISTVSKLITSLPNSSIIKINQQSAHLQNVDPHQVISLIATTDHYRAQQISEQEYHQLQSSNHLLNDPIEKPTNLKQLEQNLENQKSPVTMLSLSGLTCMSCVMKVEKGLKKVDGVEQVQINLAENIAIIHSKADNKQLIQAVEQAGYHAKIMDDHKEHPKENSRPMLYKAIAALIFGISLMVEMFVTKMELSSNSNFYFIVIGIITLLFIIVTGGHFYKKAYRDLMNLSSSMDTLIALSTGIAWIFSMVISINPNWIAADARHVYFESSVMIIGLINLGKWLEMRAKERSSKSLEKLLSIAPKTATVINDDKTTQELNIKSIIPGMKIRVATGDSIPVDGIIYQGNLSLDESILTGESVAIEKTINNEVFSGTIVVNGSAIVEVNKTGSQTVLSKIIFLVRQAQSSKPKIAELTDKIAAIFVPVIILIALIAAVIWYFYAPEYSIIVFTTVLIIACPCAIGLAIPMSLIAGIGRASEYGILVKNAQALQSASEIKQIVFDKTGTLTQGKLAVHHIETFNGISEQQALLYTASVEQTSKHPIAKAIVKLVNDPLLEVNDVQNINGFGLQATINGETIIVGKENLISEQNVDLSQVNQQHQGATLVYVAINNILAAVIYLLDTVRPEAKQAVADLHKQGIHVTMLTGDNHESAQAIANELGIRSVISNVLPDDKLQHIISLQQNGTQVAMVGDGVNDAPALAQANLSIAIGQGSDVAMETSDITLMQNNLLKVSESLTLSRLTMINIKQNLFAAFIYNVICIPIAAGILYPWLHMLLNPIIAALAMILSSLTVVLNASRLATIKLEKHDRLN